MSVLANTKSKSDKRFIYRNVSALRWHIDADKDPPGKINSFNEGKSALKLSINSSNLSTDSGDIIAFPGMANSAPMSNNLC